MLGKWQTAVGGELLTVEPELRHVVDFFDGLGEVRAKYGANIEEMVGMFARTQGEAGDIFRRGMEDMIRYDMVRLRIYQLRCRCKRTRLGKGNANTDARQISRKVCRRPCPQRGRGPREWIRCIF